MQLFFCALIIKNGKTRIYFCTNIGIDIDICNIIAIIKDIY